MESLLRTYSSQVFKCISDEYGCVKAAAAWTQALLQHLGGLKVYTGEIQEIYDISIDVKHDDLEQVIPLKDGIFGYLS